MNLRRLHRLGTTATAELFLVSHRLQVAEQRSLADASQGAELFHGELFGVIQRCGQHQLLRIEEFRAATTLPTCPGRG